MAKVDIKVIYNLKDSLSPSRSNGFHIFIMLLVIWFICSLVLLNGAYAEESFFCDTSNKNRKKFEKEAQQILNLLGTIESQKHMTLDSSKLKCFKRITDYPESKIIFSIAIQSMDSYYTFNRGNGFRLDEKKWIEFKNSMKKFGKEKKVKTVNCYVPKNLQVQIVEKSRHLLKGLNKIYALTQTSYAPIDYYEAYCIEYSTPEFGKVRVYGFGSGNQGDFDFSFNKHINLISIYNEF